jgi:DNA-binding LacI/PurR family transcriptional regulator
MSITLADIAKKTGTSISSVSAALKGNRSTAKVSEETRKRITEEAARLGYRSSHIARTLKIGRTDILGFITGEIHTPHYGEIATMLMEEAEMYGLSVQMYVTRWKAEREIKALDQLLAGRCDGLILLGGDILHNHPSAADYIRRHHFPTIFINNVVPDFPGVCEDWSTGFRDAVCYLRERQIADAVFIGNQVHNTERPKLKALIDACSDVGISLRLVENALSQDQAWSYGKSLKNATIRPRIIFAESDAVAMPLMRGIFEAGLRIPEDIGVIGHDDSMLSKYCIPTMATIGFDKAMLVKKIIATLNETITSGNWTAEEIKIPTIFIKGESI